MSTEKIDVATSIIKGLINDEELSMHDFSVVLNNAFCHGDIIPEASQEVLDKVYEGIECFAEAANCE